MHAELISTYQSYHRLGSKLPKSLKASASAPLLISPRQSWKRCPTRLLIVGQETNGWGAPASTKAKEGVSTLEQFCAHPDGVKSMLSAYRSFDFAKNYQHRNSAFWRAFRHLEDRVADARCEAMWTNLYRVDVDGSVMKHCTAEHRRLLAKAQSGLLAAETRLLQPRVVVFFTGPIYDEELIRAFPDASFEQLWSDRPVREAAIVKSKALPTMSIRIYHPTYLQRSQKWFLVKRLASHIREHEQQRAPSA